MNWGALTEYGQPESALRVGGAGALGPGMAAPTVPSGGDRRLSVGRWKRGRLGRNLLIAGTAHPRPPRYVQTAKQPNRGWNMAEDAGTEAFRGPLLP